MFYSLFRLLVSSYNSPLYYFHLCILRIFISTFSFNLSKELNFNLLTKCNLSLRIILAMGDLPNKFLILSPINVFFNCTYSPSPGFYSLEFPIRFHRENQIRNSSVIRVGNKVSCVGFRNVPRTMGMKSCSNVISQYFRLRFIIIIISATIFHF